MSVVEVPDTARRIEGGESLHELMRTHAERGPGQWLRLSFSRGRFRYHRVLLAEVGEDWVVVRPVSSEKGTFVRFEQGVPPVWVWTAADEEDQG